MLAAVLFGTAVRAQEWDMTHMPMEPAMASECGFFDETQGECDPMECYENGWCDAAEEDGCPAGSEEECNWNHELGWHCKCMSIECPAGMVPFMDWRKNEAVCVEGKPIKIVSEYEAVEGKYSWEKDCGQGRDEWDNLKWGQAKQYNWNTGMCEEREDCGAGYILQWGHKGEFCMGRGSQLLCNTDEMLAHQWSMTDGSNGEGERITCLQKTNRHEVRTQHTFNYHPIVEENIEHTHHAAHDMLAHSTTDMNEAGEMEWKAQTETDYLLEEANDMTSEGHAPHHAEDKQLEVNEYEAIETFAEEKDNTMENDTVDNGEWYYAAGDYTGSDYTYDNNSGDWDQDYAAGEYTGTDYTYDNNSGDWDQDYATGDYYGSDYDNTYDYETTMAGSSGFSKKHKKSVQRHMEAPKKNAPKKNAPKNTGYKGKKAKKVVKAKKGYKKGAKKVRRSRKH